jgi:histidyl-tRNA synthetase
MSEVKRIKPTLSKGTRDFLPSEVAKRNYIFDTIKSVFRKYGFEEIETPAIERLETLTGKYGEEGDKLLFKILNSGDYLSEVRSKNLEVGSLTPQEVTPLIAEKGLRYDLTVPLARYVVQHQDNLAFPFRRFHLGPVWRADRPQRGRYQEFYQCDADVIGSNSLLNEVELTEIYATVFQKLNIPAVIKINNRKLIEDIIAEVGVAERKGGVITVIDKLDKIGKDGVATELTKLGLTNEQTGELLNFIRLSYADCLQAFPESTGAKEVATVMGYFKNNVMVQFDASLMRGLDYYTGTIWEIVCDAVSIGSLCGGGRYDNLTEMFGGQNMSGVGISFGIERIYDVMEELNLFPTTISQGVKVLFVPREQSVEEFTFRQVDHLRKAGIPAEIFLGNVKKQKQFNYVEQKNIPYLVEVGENEQSTGLFRLRNAKTRETHNDLSLQAMIERLNSENKTNC